MQPIARNESFDCAHCARHVSPAPSGYRNHCPFCLYSLHVDESIPGDREATCHGLMRPVGCTYHSHKSHQLILECMTCHKIHRNILADDDAMELIPDLIALENSRLYMNAGRKRTK